MRWILAIASGLLIWFLVKSGLDKGQAFLVSMIIPVAIVGFTIVQANMQAKNSDASSAEADEKSDT